MKIRTENWYKELQAQIKEIRPKMKKFILIERAIVKFDEINFIRIHTKIDGTHQILVTLDDGNVIEAYANLIGWSDTYKSLYEIYNELTMHESENEDKG